MPRYAKDINAIYISERMQENLRHIKKCVLTAVIAPMGYGKTTASLWYLEERRKKGDKVFRVNIYSSDVNMFWQSFCGAFYGTELGERLLGMELPQTPMAINMLISNMSDYLDNLENDLFLLIDDCHLLEDNHIFNILFSLCDIPTEKLHIIVISRNEVFLRGEELHLGNRIHKITVDDMKLNRGELSSYLRRCGVELSGEDFETLLQNSEGWFSCLYLNLRNYEKNGVLLSKGEDIYAMIGETLYAGYNCVEQKFLTDMCLADEFSVPQAEFVTQNPNAKEIIKNLARNNAFIRYLADTDTYRFHHMLKGYAEKMVFKLSDKEQRDLKHRYACWYESQKQYQEAIMFFSQAEDRVSALRVIGVDRAIQLSAIKPEWTCALLDKCSDEELISQPQGLLVLMRRLFSWQKIPKMLELKNLVLKAAENPLLTQEERNNLLGDCDLMMSFLGYNDISAMSKLHKRACELMTRPSVSIQKNGSWTFGSPSVLMMFHRESGNLDSEIEEMNTCMPFYYKVVDNQGMGAERIMEAEALYNRGLFVDAHIMLEKARIAANEENQYFILMCCDFLALRMSYCGKLSRNVLWYEECREQFKRLHDPLLFTVLDGCAAYLYALLEQTDKIPQWIYEGRLEDGNILNPARPMYEIIYNQVLLLQKKYATVIGRGEFLLKACRGIHYMLCEIHLHIQLAIANYALGKSDTAADELKEAFRLALPDEIMLPFAENGRMLMPLLKQAPTEYRAFAERICAIAEMIDNEQSVSPSPWDILTEREKMVAVLYGSGKNRKEIACELYLSEGTVKNYIGAVYSKLALTGTPKQKHMALSEIVFRHFKKM